MAFDLILNPLVGPINEGDPLTITGTVSDLDVTGGEVTFDVDFGDGTTSLFGIIDGGAEDTDGVANGSIDFSFDNTFNNDGSFTVTVDATESVVVGTDAVFVIDTSGSTSSSSGIDVDGDGSSDTILEAEVAAFKGLNQSLIDRGLGNTSKVSVSAYSSSAFLLDLDPVAPGVQTFTTPLADTDNNGVRDVDQALDSLSSGGGTNFGSGLQQAITAIGNAGTAPGQGSVIFLSDGFGSGGVPQANTITTTLGQELRAFGVGSGSSLSQLQNLDPNAEQFTDIQDLLDLFDGTGSSTNQDTETATIEVLEVSTPIIPNPVTNPLNPVGGTYGNDGLQGTDGDDYLEGLGGNDALEGLAGNDVLNGGSGTDTATYERDTAGVTVDLAAGTATDGFGDTDTLIDIENVIGSGFADDITGDGGANSLSGGDGNDTIAGGAGNDFINGGARADSLTGGAGNDTFLYINPSDAGDQITDFVSGEDTVMIVGAVFEAFSPGLNGGSPTPDQFFLGASATNADHRFGYNSVTGDVLFDRDGVGGAAADILATLAAAPAFDRTDIVVI